MDFKSQNKGKAISASTPSFSFRYNAEDEEVEQVYTPISDTESPKVDDSPLSSSNPESKEETKVKNSSPVLKRKKRTQSLEEGGSPEPWRLFKEIQGRITKTVEEKIEEIKTDRINRKAKKKKLLNSSSLSDSEERSEASSSLKDISEKSSSEQQRDTIADSDLGDISDTSLTPDITEVDISETTPSKETERLNPRKSLSLDTPIGSLSEKPIHLSHKKPKLKSRSKIEMGTEAVEETAGKEEGRLVQVRRSSLENLRNCGMMPTVSVRAALYFALLSILYTFVNVPQFLFGLILGVFLSFEITVWADSWFQCIRGKSITESSANNFSGFLTNSALTSSEDSPVISYEGWINEFCHEYQPEIYHVTQTETVYIRLEGSIMKLASPHQKISKRAIWNEPNYKLRFDRERTYDISGCQVVLLPDKLIHKRIWSKKYPICIILKPDSHLGTRYRERGAPFLEFVSFKGYSAKSTEGNEKESCSEENIESPVENEKKDSLLSEDDGEVIFYSEDEEEDDGLSGDYVKIPTSILNKSNIYLFTRTDREKDLWFRRLVAAAKVKSDLEAQSISEINEEKEFVETEKLESPEKLCYAAMARLLRRRISSDGADEGMDIAEDDNAGIAWFNLFMGRILFDTMHDPHWIKQLQEKIQRKLSAIKVPPFMEELLVSQVELSDSIPVIEKCGLPRLNEEGVWADLDISYKGTFKMAIDTKINIIKLKNSKLEGAMAKIEGNESPEIPEKSIPNPAIFDSDVEDTAESSEDEIDPEDPNRSGYNSRNTSHKVLKMVDKIASSKYFQQVTDNKYVKKALEGVSNTTISLVVEVKSLIGTVVLNFPPPPSDRLWYGFRPNTKLTISAKPRVGQRGINMGYITNYIERKLLREFEKILVIPNMDDLIITIMNKAKPS